MKTKIKPSVTGILAATALLAVAAPASASQQDHLRDCKAEVISGGHAASSDDIKFKRANSRTVTLDVAGTKAVCKFRRGVLATVTVDGRDYALGEKAVRKQAAK